MGMGLFSVMMQREMKDNKPARTNYLIRLRALQLHYVSMK
jgi:hypothetical protein